MTLERTIKPTLTPFLLNAGDTINLTLSRGKAWNMTLLGSTAAITKHGTPPYNDSGHYRGNVAVYEFSAQVEINGQPHTFRREVGSQASFYQPWVVDGVTIWFDASAAAFTHHGGFMEEKDWRQSYICCPSRLTRWAVQEEGLGICPETLCDWFPNPKRPLDIRDCYTGEDCWMGPYNGGSTHCGLDINMAIGTPLFAPFALDTQYLFHNIASNFGNNRWIGQRLWPDGSLWQIQAHHVVEVTVPPHTPLRAGQAYASAAGIAYGATPHSHFLWRISEQGGTYLLDPWILFERTRPS